MHENEGGGSNGGFGSITMTEAAIIGRGLGLLAKSWAKGLGCHRQRSGLWFGGDLMVSECI